MNYHSKNTNFPCLDWLSIATVHLPLLGGHKAQGSSDLMEKADLKYNN